MGKISIGLKDMMRPLDANPPQQTTPSAASPAGADGDPAGPRAALWSAVLFLAAMWAFVAGVPGDFLYWDDSYYVRENALLLVPSAGNIATAFTQSYFSNYHPLTILSYMLDVQLFAYWAPWFRCVNIFLHAATVLAAFGLLRQLGARWWVAWWAALLFAVHPLRVESVIWVSERKDVLCALFYVLALWLWVRASGPDRRPWLIVGALVCTLLALLAKAMAVSLPLVFLLHDALLARGRMRGRVPAYVAAMGLGAGFMMANMAAQHLAVASNLTLLDRVGLAVYNPFHYLRTTLWPLGLSPMYPIEARPSAGIAGMIAGIATCAGALALVAWSIPRQPKLAWGLIATAVCLGPVSGLVAVGSAWAADRYSYLPTLLLLAGVAPVASAALDRASRTIRRAAATSAAVAAVLLVTGTQAYLPNWLDDAALWGRAHRQFPEVPRLEIAQVMFRLGRVADSRALAGRVEEIRRMDSRVMNLGELSMALETVGNVGNTTGAIAAADRNPDRKVGLRQGLQMLIDRNEPDAALIKARELLALGDRIEHDDKALAALALVMAGQDDEARPILLALDWPTRSAASAWGHLAKRTMERGDRRAALADAQRAMAILPGEPNALRTAVAASLALGDRDGAVRIARRGARHFATPSYARALALVMLSTQLADGDGPQRERDEAAARDKIAAEYFSSAELVYLAFLAEQGRRNAWAGELYQQALDRDRTSVPAREGLAFIALSAGDLPRAEELFVEILKLEPGNPAARQNLDRVRAQRAPTGS